MKSFKKAFPLALVCACLSVLLETAPAFAVGEVTLTTHRWKDTREYVATVPLGYHSIVPVTKPGRFPLKRATTKARLKGLHARVGTNSDFLCDRLRVPGHMFMMNQEIWTTGRPGGGAIYLQGQGQAWVENAAVHVALDPELGRSTRITGVNPCRPRHGAVLYTKRSGDALPPPSDRCYTPLSRTSEPYWSPDLTTSIIDYGVGTTVCQHAPLPRPVLVSGADPDIEPGPTHLVVDPGHPGVSSIIGGSWLAVENRVNVAPSDAQGKDCGINECPDGYMSGRTPRTMLCVSPDNVTAYVVVVDGKPANRNGLTPPMLGGFGVRRLAAGACVNLDGGGSSVMMFRGKEVSRPSYGYQREVIFSTAVF